MYRFAKERKVWWPIKVGTINDQGKMEEAEVRIFYKLLDRDELPKADESDKGVTEMFKKLAELVQGTGKGDELTLSHVFGWEGIADQDGKPIEFSQEALKGTLKDPRFARAVAMGLAQASFGAEIKN